MDPPLPETGSRDRENSFSCLGAAKNKEGSIRDQKWQTEGEPSRQAALRSYTSPQVEFFSDHGEFEERLERGFFGKAMARRRRVRLMISSAYCCVSSK